MVVGESGMRVGSALSVKLDEKIIWNILSAADECDEWKSTQRLRQSRPVALALTSTKLQHG